MDAITSDVMTKILIGIGLDTISLVAGIALTYLVCVVRHRGIGNILALVSIGIMGAALAAVLFVSVNACMSTVWRMYGVLIVPFVLVWAWAWVRIEESLAHENEKNYVDRY